MLGGSGIFVKISESSPSLIAFYRSLFALPFLYLWMKYQEKDESSNIVWNRRNKFFLILGGKERREVKNERREVMRSRSDVYGSWVTACASAVTRLPAPSPASWSESPEVPDMQALMLGLHHTHFHRYQVLSPTSK